jgi:hypothetical protein
MSSLNTSTVSLATLLSSWKTVLLILGGLLLANIFYRIAKQLRFTYFVHTSPEFKKIPAMEKHWAFGNLIVSVFIFLF